MKFCQMYGNHTRFASAAISEGFGLEGGMFTCWVQGTKEGVYDQRNDDRIGYGNVAQEQVSERASFVQTL